MSILDHQCTNEDGEILDLLIIAGRYALRIAVIVAAIFLLYEPIAFAVAKYWK